MKLMQLPSLFVRGSIATQTMTQLTRDDIGRINAVVKEVENDNAVAGDKYEFIKQLGVTIGGDYKSDPNTALQEFRIAIWRATVHLLFHCDYTYICSICGASEYTTCSRKARQFDRQYKICPKCHKTYLKSGDMTPYTISKTGKTYRLTGTDTLTFRSKDEAGEVCRSPIVVTPGDHKVENPDVILNDPVQRNKWYTVWIWNYFRQILNENIIRTHNKHVTNISGPADYVAYQLIANELRRAKCKFTYNEYEAVTGNSDILINADIMFIEPRISTYIYLLSKEYAGYNIEISMQRNGTQWANVINIHRTGEPKIADAAIETEEQVTMLRFGESKEEDGGDCWQDELDYHSAQKEIYDGEINRLISTEAMTIVRTNLFDDRAKMTFDILSQTGEVWARFSSQWGQRPARKIHIAKFLNVTPKQVDQYKYMIMSQCLIHDLKSANSKKSNLADALRMAEDEICHDITGDIFSICVLYRYLCRGIAKKNAIYKIDELPQRLYDRITGEAYRIIVDRISKLIY